MGNLKNFLSPKRLPFHLLLAVVVSLILAFVAIKFLDVYTFHGQEKPLPSYIGRNADSLLNDHGSEFVFVVRSTVYDKDKPEGTVVEQDPLPAENVKQNRKVYLTISSTVPPTVEMPQLAGDITLRQAITILEDSGLELDKIIYTPSENVNLVLEQYYKGRPIKKGAKLNKGSKITLEIGANIKDICAPTDQLEVDDFDIDPNDENSGENFYYNN